MSSWIAAVAAVLKVIAALVDAAQREKSEAAGAAAALLKVSQDALTDIQAASEARLAQRARDAGGIVYDDADPYLRD